MTLDQGKRGRAIYRVLGRVLGMRYSKFEITHLRRGEPEEIVRHWERIAIAFQRYSARHLLDERQEYALFDHLLEIAFDSAKAVAAGHQYWDDLAATYSGTAEQDPRVELHPRPADALAG